MIEEMAGVAVVFDGAKLPVKIKAKWYHYVGAFLWNLWRKPLVFVRQRELQRIYVTIKKSLEETVLPVLYERRTSCSACYNAYLSLKPQVFLSQIELILLRMACEEHPTIYQSFIRTWNSEFRRSEKIAQWINFG